MDCGIIFGYLQVHTLNNFSLSHFLIANALHSVSRFRKGRVLDAMKLSLLSLLLLSPLPNICNLLSPHSLLISASMSNEQEYEERMREERADE